MLVATKMFVQNARKRVSGQGNVYWMLDLTEKTEHKNEQGAPITRDWKNVYYSTPNPETDVKAFEKSERTINFSFYPMDKKVGEKEYHEVKCAILHIE